MESRRKRKKFGCPTGRHTFRNRQIEKSRRIEQRKKQLSSLKNSFYNAVPTDSLKLHIKKVSEPDTENREGYRIVHLEAINELLHTVTRHVGTCHKALDRISGNQDTLKLTGVSKNSGLASTLTVYCLGCAHRFKIETSPKIEIQGKSHYDINVRAVWGQMTSGGGCAKLAESLNTMGISALSATTFTQLETDIGKCWKEELQVEMLAAVEEEKKYAMECNSYHEGIPAISVICDGGWCKRSHKHTYNALGGVGVVLGLHTKRILDIGVRNKICAVCTRAETLGEEVRQHECHKNWDDSSQSMETDIMLTAFNECEEKYGLRYTKLIADGDSSTFTTLVAEGPVWCRDLQKLECANHVAKCVRASLEKLVDQNPQYKGINRLTKSMRVRLSTIVRCAIKMRSKENNRLEAIQRLKHDIRNSFNHVFGQHDQCSADVCSVKQTVLSTSIQLHVSPQPNTSSYNFEEETSDSQEFSSTGRSSSGVAFWSDWTPAVAVKEAMGDRPGGAVNVDADLRSAVMVILNRTAEKADRLIHNVTTNLAENWMSIRTKFDGGKVYNRCGKGSWKARCHGAALRRNLGSQWSAKVWEKVTNTKATSTFHIMGRRNELSLKAKCQSQKEEVQARRRKRKMQRDSQNSSKKAKMSYGTDVAEVCEDLNKAQLKEKCDTFYKEKVCLPPSQCRCLEERTRQQLLCPEWHTARKVRLTASNFGTIMTKTPNTQLKRTVENMLYTNFKGTSATMFGLRQERATIQEYELRRCSSVSNVKVEHCGIFVNPLYPYLGASPDGVVYIDGNVSGILEVKNVLKDKPITLVEASKSSSFCLYNTDNGLHLKESHQYYYQCQGQLQVTQFPWLDFVVRTVEPYELHIERIFPDKNLWEHHMLPKLQNFYFKALLPELAEPRHGKVPGIREPGPKWNDDSKTVDTLTAPTSVPPPTTENTPQTENRPRRSCRSTTVKFVGKQIKHLWISNKKRKWFPGTVLLLVSGTDGCPDAEHEVQYDGDKNKYIVDHLLEDYRKKEVCFI